MMLLLRIVALRLLVLRVLMPTEVTVTSLAVPPERVNPLLGTHKLRHQSGDMFKRQRTNHLFELEAISRYERQIRFKDSYQQLPQGFPELLDGNAHKNADLSYFVQVDVEEPLLHMNFRDLPKGATTYFPPEVIPLDLLNSSEEEGGHGYFTFQNEQAATASEEINSLTSTRAVAVSPFYIPSHGNSYDSTHKASSLTEPSIYLTKDFFTTSHLTYPWFHSEATEIEDHNGYNVAAPSFVTSPPLNHGDSSRESKEQSHNVLTVGKRHFDPQPVFYYTVTKPSLPLSIAHSPKAQASVASTPPTSDAPFFIIDNDNRITSDNTDEKLSSPHIIINKSRPIIDFPIPPRTLSLPSELSHYSTFISNNNKNKPFYDMQSVSRTLYPPPKLSYTQPSKLESSSDISKTTFKFTKGNAEGFSNGIAKDSKLKNGSGLSSVIPGISGTDYPTYQTPPETSFDCSAKVFGGYYADPKTKCQVFHVCLGKKSAAFVCPIGTLFSQKLLVCDWWYNVNCSPNHTQL